MNQDQPPSNELSPQQQPEEADEAARKKLEAAGTAQERIYEIASAALAKAAACDAQQELEKRKQTGGQ